MEKKKKFNIKKYNTFINEAGGYDSFNIHNEHSWYIIKNLAKNLYFMKDAYINMFNLEEEIMGEDMLKNEVKNFLKKFEPLIPMIDHLDSVLFDVDQKNMKKFGKDGNNDDV